MSVRFSTISHFWHEIGHMIPNCKGSDSHKFLRIFFHGKKWMPSAYPNNSYFGEKLNGDQENSFDT